jgi:Concanavalin A-like lectin/glucanases superfamily
VRGLNIALLVLCACGRLGFDSEPPAPTPVSQASDETTNLGTAVSNGSTIDNGLVAHFAFDGSLIDSVSNTDAECSGNACPSFVPGVGMGEAASFDGAATCVQVPWLTSWMPSQYTISAWIQPTSMSGPVVVREHDTSCPSPDLQTSDAAVGFIATDISTGHQEAWSGAALTQSTWTHVAIEFDGTNQSVFVNGACACAVTPTIALAYATYEVTIGCYPAASQWFTGAMDDVRIYDRPLAGTELATLAGAANSTDCAAVCNTVQP